MGIPDDGDRRNPYERQIEERRPPGRRVGENRAAHRARLRKRAGQMKKKGAA